MRELSAVYLPAILALLVLAEGYVHYQERIPNGDQVPHPCLPGRSWPGLGHQQAQGMGARNAFGKDFHENGNIWDECLCRRDSDHDGKTNGEELGDPDCSWKPREKPTRTENITHPGICEPINDEKCKSFNDWEFCKDSDIFKCDAVKDEGVQNVTFRFPKTKVPARETTYWCMTFDFPNDTQEGDYHVIASKPEIDNHFVMHHILVYGCTEKPGDPLHKIPAPGECGMAQNDCRDIIAFWAPGYAGGCITGPYGFRIGQSGYKTVLMQMHWNNPPLRVDHEDSSGMTFFYTANLRDFDAGVLITGPTTLNLPAGRNTVTQSGTCSHVCTENIPRELHIVESTLHMHLLGKAVSADLYRNGKKIQTIDQNEYYNYDFPQFNVMKPPVIVQPGDEIRTTCAFKTLYKKEVTHFGEATSDEMCLSFLVYYPRQANFTHCLSVYDADYCVLKPDKQSQVGGCNVTDFFDEELGPLKGQLRQICGDGNCSLSCRQKINEILDGACFQSEAIRYVKDYALQTPGGWNFLHNLQRCDPEPRNEDEDEDNETKQDDDHSDKVGQECPFEKNPIGLPVDSSSTSKADYALLVCLGFLSVLLAMRA